MFFDNDVVQNLQQIDEIVFTYVRHLHSVQGIQFMVHVSDFFDPIHVLLYTIVLMLLLWLHKKNTHLLQFAFSMGIGALVIVALKYGLKTPRPSHALIQETGYSFASGHAAVSAIFFILVAYMYMNHIQKGYLRAIWVVGCVSMVLLVGASRVYLEVHYFTDVVAGIAIGTIISAFSILYFRHR